VRISIFGLGYVGTVSCGCLAKQGHQVIGVDVSKPKVDMINSGYSPLVEPDIGEIIKEAVAEERLRVVQESEDAILNTEVSFVSVGTPSKANGSLDLGYVRKVCEEIGSALRKKTRYHLVVLRSTMLPGSTRNLVIPSLEQHSEKKMGQGFGVCFNPEFLREGSAVYDFYNPPKIVVGADRQKDAEVVCNIYEGIPGPVSVTSIESSEMVKYADNTFHALKVTFANEIGIICKQLQIDSHEVMEIFCSDMKLNLSPNYLRPGFAFGGSCLPKDLRALTYQAKIMDVDTPLLNSILLSNDNQIRNVVKAIVRLGKKRIGFLGCTFKAGTDDLRESPVIEVIETLIGKGYQVVLYDHNINLTRLIGANRSYIEQHIPHIAHLLRENVKEVINECEVVVVGHNSEEFREPLAQANSELIIYDLVRLVRERKTGENYIGIAW
jgi:GDP-mannose 6-dehydrogenase